jgi:hypothetical protein
LFRLPDFSVEGEAVRGVHESVEDELAGHDCRAAAQECRNFFRHAGYVQT